MRKKAKALIKITAGCAGALAIAGIWHFTHMSEKTIIGVIPQYNSSEFQRTESGLMEAVQKMGYELVVKIPEEMTVQAQRKAMEQLVKEGADCILVEAVAEGGFQDVLDECGSREIPVLAYNSRINSQDIYAEILPYPIESVASAILSAIDSGMEKSGQFGVLSTNSQDYLREARTRSMIVELENGAYPEVHFTGSGFAKEDENLIAEKAEQLGKKYPDLEYLVCYSTLDAKGISNYIEENQIPWKLICEASLEELDFAVPEGTIALTYDYKRYGRFLAKLAADAMISSQAPVQGDSFEWEDERTYIFQKKWGWDSSETNEDADAGTPNLCSISMQERPEVVVWKNGKWE